MYTYAIKQVTGLPDWSRIETLHLNHILWLPDAGIRMSQQICRDEKKLYVHQKAVEEHIRAEHDAPLGMVCEDSCMEFFFGFGETDPRYFNFEWNSKGCLYLGFGKNRYESTRLLPRNPKELFAFRCNLTQDGWEIFYEIPAAFVQLFIPEFSLASGGMLRANCYKCGDLTPRVHYLSWNPVTSATPDFHRPQDFGTMVLE